jgi:hypothetical protein
MKKKLFEKKIKALSKTEAKDVLRVVASQTVTHVIKAVEDGGGCPGYTCCPCDAKAPGQCGCEGYCHCGKNDFINLRNMEIYESLRNADEDTFKEVKQMLQAKVK